MEHKVVTDYTNVNTQNEYLKVYVRARPPENADHAAEDMFTVGPGTGSSSGANKKVVLKVRSARAWAVCFHAHWRRCTGRCWPSTGLTRTHPPLQRLLRMVTTGPAANELW